MAADVPAIIVGKGRIATALAGMGACEDVVVGREDDIPEDFPGPIYVTTRNNDLDAVVAKTPPSRQEDLVFMQNGMMDPWFDAKGLDQKTQVLLYMAVAKLGEEPTDGITELNPEGLTAANGKWAGAFKARLATGGMTCNVLDPEAFERAMFEKLVWISAFMLVGVKHGGVTVGEVEQEHTQEVRSLIKELVVGTAQVKGLTFDPIEEVEERLLAYTRTVAHFPTAVKEFEWRNGWFHAISTQAKEDPFPTHTAWLEEVGAIPASVA